ncbi:hypothetical protein BUL40_02280 [Croceivirga radicis]|uniref:Adhesin domain-containing protein n=1 Tax=Croceivirga radicis TaxID=1929488 RepID=A0A1V6LW43_9FLAO|nr:hypothetical protein BUL40_02280 [Croceivirga radicis]
MRSLLLFLICCIGHCYAQKVVQKSFASTDTKYFHVDASDCYAITVKTIEGNQAIVEGKIEGEYAKDLAIKLEEDGQNIFISAGFLPTFTAPNDKLSAHKVISISLQISLPKAQQIEIHGTNSNVTISGTFDKVNVVLADGDCNLNNVIGQVKVKTQKGSINVHKGRGTIAASSKYGKVFKEKELQGYSTFNLSSIEGDIWINRVD